jgi:ribosomal protein S26
MTAFVTCRTCGRYTPAARAVNRAWCCEECARAYSTCVNCGKAFPRGKGHDAEHCSRECTVQYHIYRKFGPEPITVVTEV